MSHYYSPIELVYLQMLYTQQTVVLFLKKTYGSVQKSVQKNSYMVMKIQSGKYKLVKPKENSPRI